MSELIMLVSMAGPGISLSVDDRYECDEAQAGRLVAAGFATLAEAKPAERKRAARKGKAD